MNKLQAIGEDIQSLQNKLDKYHQIYLIVLATPIMGGAVLQAIFLALFRLSPWVSIIGILLSFLAVILVHKWNNATIKGSNAKNRTRQTDYLIIGMFVAQGITAVIAISNLTYLLHYFHAVDYIETDNQVFNALQSIDNYTRFYFWYLFNSIPGVDCNSFNWHQQIVPNNFLSKLIVFVIQVYVTFIFIRGIKDWLDNRNLKKKGKAAVEPPELEKPNQ